MLKNLYKNISKKMNSTNKLNNSKWIGDLQFVNSYMNDLIVKEVENPQSPQTTKGCNYTKVKSTAVRNPRLVYISPQVCNFLNLDRERLLNSEEAGEYLSGNKMIKSSEPVAHCYVGHQFGVMAGQLGDGRAITLGDIRTEEDRNIYSSNRDSTGQLWELQLKGAGLTPYSRFADGRAVLRSSIREFLCCEHLWSLGIPTTRALSIVNSDSTVKRDPLYTGDVINENCAIVCRLSPTFFRFGSFEIFVKSDPLTGTSGPSVGMEQEMLPKMINYLAQNHFTQLYQDNKDTFKLKMFELIITRTAILAAFWQSYSFCHGVLNTDNMSILGLTIDFGPFGFMEFFDNFFICNHSDKNGRYNYQNQPEICKWNLKKLSESLFINENFEKNIINEIFDKIYKDFYYFLNAKKIGLILTNEIIKKEDRKLIDDMYSLMEDFGFDFTLFFRFLSNIKTKDDDISVNEFIQKMIKYSMPRSIKMSKIKPKMNENALNSLRELREMSPMLLYQYGLDPELVDNEIRKQKEYLEFQNNYKDEKIYELEKNKKLENWIKTYQERLNKEFEGIKSFNNKENLNKTINLFEENFMFKYPLSENAFKNVLYEECQNLLKSERLNDIQNLDYFDEIKKEFMNKINPKFILRNHIAQRVIEKAEEGDYSELDKVFKILTSPFDEHLEVKFEEEFDTSILLAYNICVSCSS